MGFNDLVTFRKTQANQPRGGDQGHRQIAIPNETRRATENWSVHITGKIAGAHYLNSLGGFFVVIEIPTMKQAWTFYKLLSWSMLICWWNYSPEIDLRWKPMNLPNEK